MKTQDINFYQYIQQLKSKDGLKTVADYMDCILSLIEFEVKVNKFDFVRIYVNKYQRYISINKDSFFDLDLDFLETLTQKIIQLKDLGFTVNYHHPYAEIIDIRIYW